MIQIDMEMPRSCLDCRFCIEEPYGGANCIASGIWGREICEHVESIPCVIRKKWCPLTETTDTKWHVVAEGDLPEDDREVLITYKSNIDGELNVDITSYCEVALGGRGMGYKEWGSPFPYFHVDNEVLAWRELPEPWEGAEK